MTNGPSLAGSPSSTATFAPPGSTGGASAHFRDSGEKTAMAGSVLASAARPGCPGTKPRATTATRKVRLMLIPPSRARRAPSAGATADHHYDRAKLLEEGSEPFRVFRDTRSGDDKRCLWRGDASARN